jgi:hypothetical protein
MNSTGDKGVDKDQQNHHGRTVRKHANDGAGSDQDLKYNTFSLVLEIRGRSLSLGHTLRSDNVEFSRQMAPAYCT